MVKLIISIILIFNICIMLAGCNPVARKTDGNKTIHLKSGEKLINVIWAYPSLWFLTKPMKTDDIAETYNFKQVSTLGISERIITIVEHK